MKRVLFVTWDGPDQNYLESLFLPIFSAVAGRGYRFEVLQFRWGDEALTRHVRAAANARGVGYRSVQILRRPKAIGALASVAHGVATLRRLLTTSTFDVVMPRSILPAQIVGGVRSRLPMLFDADGLPADERVEFGGWREQGAFYRIWRDIEAQAVRRAAAVITRTSHAKRVLLDRAGPSVEDTRIVVVPNGKDEDVFQPASKQERAEARARLGIPFEAPWIVFVGSIGPQYCLAELIAFYRQVVARDPETRLTVLTGQEREVRELFVANGLSSPHVTVRRAPPHEVPAYLAAADLGVAFRLPSFSQSAVSPIKIAEYLLCGLPILATRGVGDLDSQVPAAAGMLLSDLEASSLGAASDWFLTQVLPRRGEYASAARRTGLASFSLAVCAEGYARALDTALGTRSSP